MARLSLIVNPKASRVSRRRIKLVRDSLSSSHKVDVELTSRRGDARQIAADAVADGAEAVIVLAGDGTLGETYGALAHTPVPVGVIPAGGTNVVARTLGMSEHPRAALAQLHRALALGPRPIGLGSANGTYFGFVAGFGLDASTVHLVEQRRWARRYLGDLLFGVSGVQAFARSDRRHPPLSVHMPDGTAIGDIYHLMVSNSSPYTFAGNTPLVLAPDAHFNRPLSVTGFRRMTLGFTLRMLSRSLRGRSLSGQDGVALLPDLPRFEVRAAVPVDLQLDGDYIGRPSAVSFEYHPSALLVLS